MNEGPGGKVMGGVRSQSWVLGVPDLGRCLIRRERLPDLARLISQPSTALPKIDLPPRNTPEPSLLTLSEVHRATDPGPLRSHPHFQALLEMYVDDVER
jgi:hypothetical protein